MTKKELFTILMGADIETGRGGYCARFDDADDFMQARKALAAVGSLVEKTALAAVYRVPVGASVKHVIIVDDDC